MNPSGTTILVSPKGKLYLVNVITGELKWSYEMRDYKDKRICKAEQKHGVEDYMDAKLNDDGEIFLCRYINDQCVHVIPLASNEEVEMSIKYFYHDADINISRPKIMHLDLEGNRLRKSTAGRTDYFQIQKTEYYISNGDWRLRFYNYRAIYFFNYESTLQIPVHHTHEFEAFRDYCRTFITANYDEMEYDLWIQENTLGDMVDLNDQGGERYGGVFEGHIGSSFKVIVKFRSKDDGIPLNVRNLWGYNNQHFRTFFGLNINENAYGLIFEYCTYTLFRYSALVDHTQRKQQEEFLGVMRGLVAGLGFLHGSDMCHTNLNPWNVLVTNDFRTKISGYSQFESKSPDRRVSDLLALAKLIRFCHSHIDPHLTEARYDTMGQILMFDWAPEAKHIAELLESSRPPSLSIVSRHPFLWTLETYIEFVIQVSDFMEPKNAFNDSLRDAMYRERLDTFGVWHWQNRVPKGVFEKQGGTKLYNPSVPSSLLRFIRNILNNHQDVKTEEEGGVKLTSQDLEWLGENRFDALYNFRMEFPKFLTGLWSFIGRKANKGPLARFYD